LAFPEGKVNRKAVSGLAALGGAPGPATQSALEALAAAQHTGCLLCDASNPFGLRLRFGVQPSGAVEAPFDCRGVLRSYPATLHGGVISALLDAAMTNALFSVGVVGVTAELTVRFLAPVALDQAATVRGLVERDVNPLYLVRGEVEQGGKLRARASAKFFAKDCM